MLYTSKLENICKRSGYIHNSTNVWIRDLEVLIRSGGYSVSISTGYAALIFAKWNICWILYCDTLYTVPHFSGIWSLSEKIAGTSCSQMFSQTAKWYISTKCLNELEPREAYWVQDVGDMWYHFEHVFRKYLLKLVLKSLPLSVQWCS